GCLLNSIPDPGAAPVKSHRSMDRLKRLCKVLGSNYQERLDKLGIAAGHKEMDEKTSKALEQTIRVLEEAKEARFSKLQALGLKLRDLWKFHNTAPENILEFAETFACIDAESANELTKEKSLSMELISKATEEINTLEASMVAKQKKMYLGKKQKLLKLLEETHMVPADMKFDPKKKVESDFPKAISDLKIMIKQVKVQILERKDIVMRIELLQHAVNNSLSVKTSESKKYVLVYSN
uniref:Uncharacterized protein n=1 Tax=Aegilops tauschii subsp. strangulata TaxID=200361 RepID=A0A452ZNV4_AEGTS